MKIYFNFILFLIIFSQNSAIQNVEDNLKFSISITKRTCFVYEPIQLTFTLTNEQDKEIKGDYAVGGDWNREKLLVFYRKKGESFSRYSPADGDPPRCVWGIELVPSFPAHQQKSTIETILYDVRAKRYVFSTPGIYELKAEFYAKNLNKNIQSNILQITVEDVPAEENKPILDLWLDPDLSRMIQGNITSLGRNDDEVMKKLEILITNYPQSIYAQAAGEAILKRAEEQTRLGIKRGKRTEVLIQMVQKNKK